jgi:hypothetical protein
MPMGALAPTRSTGHGALMEEPEDCSVQASIALPEGWRLSLHLTRGEEDFYGGVSELYEGDVLRCRMMLSNLDRDRRVALGKVATRIELWLAEWQSRDHSGNTNFADLE